jgi:hypothetical protein
MKVLVVGWYKDAKVYRTPIVRVPRTGDGADRHDIPYTAEALAENATLLPEANRTFRAPTHHSMRGGLGQSPVWYGGNDNFRRRVWTYIQGIEGDIKAQKASRRGGGARPRNSDPELRRKIEKAAINHAIAYFTSNEGGAYDVESVESEARGWDLEATRSNERLLIEVKGLGANGGTCALTPNEYAKSCHEDHCFQYVIYIVSGCLSDAPVASIFRWSPRGIWEAADGRRLAVEPID